MKSLKDYLVESAESLHDEIVKFINKECKGGVASVNPWFEMEIFGETHNIERLEWDKYNDTYVLMYNDDNKNVEPGDLLSDLDESSLKKFYDLCKKRLK